jgi:hypothetical protein
MSSNTTVPEPAEVFATDFATLAREIAMDIFPLATILDIHRLEDAEWQRISEHPRFVAMVKQMSADWNSAGNTRERVRIKAATGLESVLEIYIRDVADTSIPLAQRVEAGKFLARLGELDTSALSAGAGDRFSITLNIGETHREIDTKVINGEAQRMAIPE